MVRLPDDNRLRPTTARGTRTDIRISHEMGVEVLFSRTDVLDQRLEQPADLADPVGHGRAVEVDAFTGVDLRLPIERQVVGVLGDQHVRHGRLGRDATLDEAGGRRRLHHDLLARPAGIFRPARHDHPELGGHDVAVALIASSPDGQYASTQTVLTSMAEALAQADTQWSSPAC